MPGELLFFAIYVLQQLGVMFGVGAQTLLLCTHLVALHHREPERPDGSFARATRVAQGIGLALIVLSGAAAIGFQFWSGDTTVLLAPAFVFKWILILAVAGAFVLQGRRAQWSDALALCAGGSWYALFLVHTLAPVTSWFNLIFFYAAWMLFFGAVWGGFVFMMRGAKRAPAKLFSSKVFGPPPPKPVPVVAAPPKISWWRRLFVRTKRAPKTPVPPIVKKITPPPPPPSPQPKPMPVVAVKVEPPPVSKSPPPPPPPPLKLILQPQVPLVLSKLVAPPAPKPAAPPPPPKPAVPKTPKEISWLPALRIMPQKPEDIARHDRPAVVQLAAEQM